MVGEYGTGSTCHSSLLLGGLAGSGRWLLMSAGGIAGDTDAGQAGRRRLPWTPWPDCGTWEPAVLREDIMVRQRGTVGPGVLLGLLVLAVAARADEAAAVKAIHKLGGRVEVDAEQPGKPVVVV